MHIMFGMMRDRMKDFFLPFFRHSKAGRFANAWFWRLHIRSGFFGVRFVTGSRALAVIITWKSFFSVIANNILRCLFRGFFFPILFSCQLFSFFIGWLITLIRRRLFLVILAGIFERFLRG